MTATAQPLAPRRRMPRQRRGYTASFTIGDADFYLTANPNEDGSLVSDLPWWVARSGLKMGSAVR